MNWNWMMTIFTSTSLVKIPMKPVSERWSHAFVTIEAISNKEWKFRQINSFAFHKIHSRSPTRHWKNEEFTLLTKIFSRQINSLVIYLLNALLSRNFCQKSVRVNFRNFHSVCTLCTKNYKNANILKIRNPIKSRDAITGTNPIWIWRFMSKNNKLWLAEIEVSMLIIGSKVIKTNKKGAKFKWDKSQL